MVKLVLVGEAWGKDEESLQHAFVGASGQELWRMLHDAGFPCESLPRYFVSPYSMTKRWEQFRFAKLLNVFNCRPPDPSGNNQAEYFFGKDEVDKTFPMRKVGQSNKWVLSAYASHVRKLYADLEQLQPNLIVALGNTPLWALGLSPSIGKMRGAITTCKWGKCLPVYHPAAVLRKWELRLPSVVDFLKAKREMAYPEVRVVEREILTEPSINDLWGWWERCGEAAPLLALDIETVKGQQVSEVSIAASSTRALHIPFLHESPKNHFTSYWPTLAEEVEAWNFFRTICASPIPKIGQNLKYDIYWLAHVMHIPVLNWTEDTMVKSHSWSPELQKSLAFLGSVFMDEKSWKHIRRELSKED